MNSEEFNTRWLSGLLTAILASPRNRCGGMLVGAEPELGPNPAMAGAMEPTNRLIVRTRYHGDFVLTVEQKQNGVQVGEQAQAVEARTESSGEAPPAWVRRRSGGT